MMPGPLPNPQRRRRNAPTVPTTTLPASGRKGRPPNCPYELGRDGAAWWRWAWTLPQAVAWSRGDLFAIARRARLEDDIAAFDFSDGMELAELLSCESAENAKRIEWALVALKRAAGSKLSIEKEMRELDAKLGLTPESMARLRWTIVDDSADEPAPTRATYTAQPQPEPTQPTKPARRAAAHLRAVDPAVVVGGAHPGLPTQDPPATDTGGGA